MYQQNNYCPCNQENRWNNDREERRQRHIHEITGSTAVFNEQGEECHNHRFVTVSDEAIRCGSSHVHEIRFRTDFADGHYHEFCGTSGIAVEVGNGKHVHFAAACTEEEDGHKHKFQVASLIDSPIDFECEM